MSKETHPQKPDREPKPPKTEAELLAEEVKKQRIRLQAASDPSLQAHLEQEEFRKSQRRLRVQQLIAQRQTAGRQGIPGKTPRYYFDEILSSAHEQLAADRREAADRSADESYDRQIQREAREDTLEIAEAAAEALRAEPNIAIALKTGSVTKTRVRASHPSRRKVMRGGILRNEAYTKHELFGKESNDLYGALAYGWEIPMSSGFNEPGSRLVLCEDGRIMSLRAQERPVSSLQDMQFHEGQEINNAAFLRPKREGQPDKAILVVDHLGYSPLTHDLQSDIAGVQPPVDNPEGAAQMLLRREMEIQEGLATLLVSNGAA